MIILTWLLIVACVVVAILLVTYRYALKVRRREWAALAARADREYAQDIGEPICETIDNPGAISDDDPRSRPAKHGTSRVSGVGKTVSIACTGGDVKVSGSSNDVRIVGKCSELSVSGVENSVTIDMAKMIRMSGVKNRIRVRSGTPVVHQSGVNNRIDVP